MCVCLVVFSECLLALDPSSSTSKNIAAGPSGFHSENYDLSTGTNNSWTDLVVCNDADYFQLTTENLKASGTNEWYENWITNNTNTKEHQDDYKRLGEPGFFAKYALNVPNFYCSLQKAACVEKPSRNDILTYVRGKQRNSSSEDVRASARRIYFTILQMDRITELVSLIYVSAISYSPMVLTDNRDVGAFRDCAN
jgi:hypothetical protein